MAGRLRSTLALGLLTSAIVPIFSASGSETVNYSYDARGRLIQVSRSGAVNDGIQAAYSYDKADNRTNVTVTGPGFSVNDVSATEGLKLAFTVTRSATASAMNVSYATSNGTATGGDYTATSGTLAFAIGEAQKTINVDTTDDTTSESSETVTLTLSNPTGGAILVDATGIGTIIDNDAPPACSGVSFTIASNGAVTEATNSRFTVTKSGTATGSCSVNYVTANGTATAGSDYTAKSGTLSFSTAQTSQTVDVTTTDDSTIESAETFSMSLSSPTGGSIVGSPGNATATINDNDGVITCSGVSFRVNDYAYDEGPPAVFTITKTGSTSNSCSVNYATADGTAIAPGDYTAVAGTLTFASNETSKTVSITTTTAPKNEPTEYFYLNLSSPSGSATISDSQGLATLDDYIPDGGGGCPLC